MKRYEGKMKNYEGKMDIIGRGTWKNSKPSSRRGGESYADTIPEMAPSTERVSRQKSVPAYWGIKNLEYYEEVWIGNLKKLPI